MKPLNCAFLIFFILVTGCIKVMAQDDDEQFKLDMKKLAPTIKLASLMYYGKFTEAMPILNKMIDSLKRVSNKKKDKKASYLQAVNSKAFLYQFMGEYAKAEQLFKQRIQEDAGLSTEENIYQRKQMLNILSMLYEKMGNYQGAQAVLEEVVITEYPEQEPFDKKTAMIDYYVNAGRMNDSIQKNALKELYKKALKKRDAASIASAKELKLLIDAPFDSVSVANSVEESLSNPDPDVDPAAMGMFNAAVQFQVSNKLLLKRPTAGQYTLLRQGKLKLGGHRNGMNFNDPWSEVQRLFITYKNLNNYAAAEELMKQAITIDDSPQGSDYPMNNFFQAALPQSLKVMGNMAGMKEMTANMKQMLNVNNKYGDVDVFYIQNKAMLAELYKETRKDEQFKLLADTVYQLSKKLDTVDNPIILNNLASSYVRIEKYKDALAVYKKIISYHKTKLSNNVISYKIYLDALQESAKLNKLIGDYKSAKVNLDQALAYDKEIHNDKYIDHLERVIAMAQWYDDIDQFNDAEKYLFTVLSPVMDNLTTNFSFLSGREKISFINNQTSTFDLSASLLYTDKHPASQFVQQAFNQLLQIKSLALNDDKQVFNNIRDSKNPALSQLFNNWQNNRKTIAWQYTLKATPAITYSIDSLTVVANDQEKKLNSLSKAYSNKTQNQQIGYKQIQSSLKGDEAAIELMRFKYYHKKWTDSVIYAAFVILPHDSEPYFIRLCEEKELAGLLNSEGSTTSKQFIDSFYGNSSTEVTNRKSDKLYQLIWEPLLSKLTGINTIVLAADGLLNRVNFNALPYNKSSYLIDKFEIRQYSSTRQISEQKQLPGYYKTNAVLFGDVAYGEQAQGSRWPSMNNLKEVSEINELFKNNKIATNMLTEENASEGNFKKMSGNSPWLIHAATHGFSIPQYKSSSKPLSVNENQFKFADDPMMRTGIVMANANKVWSGGVPVEGEDDGILTAYEISGLDLSHTELAVLSACETGLGDIKGTEGVFGLQRAFKLAGVRNMILGLWDLPVTETNQMMLNFYTNKVKGLTTYQAFRMAQESIRKNNPPYKWAGMILIE